MKKGISCFSFPQSLSLEECMKISKKAGFDGIEPLIKEEDEVNVNSTKVDIQRIKHMAKNIGIELTSLATDLLWSYPLTSSDVAVRQKGEDVLARMLEIASYLEVGTVLVIPGVVGTFSKGSTNEAIPYDLAYKRALESLRKCFSFAEKYKVTIAIENVWNKFLLSPLEMRGFVDKINSAYIGVYFDIGNVLLTGYPEHWINILSQRIKMVHIKDFRTNIGNINGFVDILEGDVNWRNVMKALRKINYDGYLVAEIIPYRYSVTASAYNASKSIDFILSLLNQ